MYQPVGEVPNELLANLRQELEQANWTHADCPGRDYFVWYTPTNEIQRFFLKIPPKGYVHRHVDRRKGVTFHIPITTNPECWCFAFDGEEHRFHLEVGSKYRVDRTIEHWSVNHGDTDRIHLLIEVDA